MLSSKTYQFECRHNIKRKKSLGPGASCTNTFKVFIVPVFRVNTFDHPGTETLCILLGSKKQKTLMLHTLKDKMRKYDELVKITCWAVALSLWFFLSKHELCWKILVQFCLFFGNLLTVSPQKNFGSRGRNDWTQQTLMLNTVNRSVYPLTHILLA